MTLYIPTVVNPGDTLSGAEVNSLFDAVAVATTSIDADQLGKSRFPINVFVEQRSEVHFNLLALSTNGTPDAIIAMPIEMQADGIFLDSTSIIASTGAPGTAVTIGIDGQSGALNPGDSVSREDIVRVTVVSGDVVDLAFALQLQPDRP